MEKKIFFPAASVKDNLKFFPEMLEQSLEHLKAWENQLSHLAKKKINQLILAGMGGSGIAGEIVQTIVRDSSPLPIFILKEASLPAFADRQTLVIISSYSGNTKEMRLLFIEAQRKKIPIVAISSGGRLAGLCQKHQLPLIYIPAGFQPRSALGYFLLPLFFILGQLKIWPFDKKNWRDLVGRLKLWRRALAQKKVGEIAKISRSLAQKIPLILATPVTAAVGGRLKNQLNENAKILAHLALFPELVHNEIMGFGHLSPGNNPFAAVILESNFESPIIQKMQSAVKKLLEKKFNQIFTLKISSQTLLEEILKLVFLVDLISIKVAEIKKINPTPIEFINQVKKVLK